MDWASYFRQMNAEYSAEFKFGHDEPVQFWNNPHQHASASHRPPQVFGGFFDDTWHVLSSPINKQVAEYGEAKANLIALNDYMHRTPAKTPKATSLVGDWSRWWITTGDPDNYSLYIPPAVWDEARNRRLAFNLANATSIEEKIAVQTTATTGLSSEQMRGQPDRRDPNTGMYYIPPPPLIPDWVKPLAIGAVALGLGLSLLPTLKKFIL